MSAHEEDHSSAQLASMALLVDAMPVAVALLVHGAADIWYRNTAFALQFPGVALVNELNRSFEPEKTFTEEVERCISERAIVNLGELHTREKSFSGSLVPLAQPEHCCIILTDETKYRQDEAARKEFFSILSHELRTPLVAVSGCAKLIQDYYHLEYPDPLLKDMTEEIIHSTDGLVSMVNDFLNMDRLEQGRFTYVLESFSAKDLVAELIRDLTGINQNPAIQLLMTECSGFNPVWADRQRSKQILTNLAGNALKFTKQGEVRFTLEAHEHGVQIRVSDTGPGIAPEDRDEVFKKFRQAHNHDALTLDPNRSSGLGLYIAKLMAEGMAGSVYLEWSEVGQGSSFCLYLPYAQ